MGNTQRGWHISCYYPDRRIKTPIQEAKESGEIDLDKLEEKFKIEIAKAYGAGLMDAEYKRERRLQNEYYNQTYGKTS
jgi:hypothetical protein